MTTDGENQTANTEDSDGGAVARVRGLAVIMIRVTDMERSVRFYEEMLGFHKGEQMLEPGITLEAGDAMIYLVEDATESAGSPDGASIRIALAVRGVEAATAALRDAGVRVVDEFERSNDFFASAAIADPDGNVIALWGKP